MECPPSNCANKIHHKVQQKPSLKQDKGTVMSKAGSGSSVLSVMVVSVNPSGTNGVFF